MRLKPGVAVDILRAEPAGALALRLVFSDGHETTVDFGPFLARCQNPETRQYLDREKFAAYRIEWGNLIWGDYEMCFAIEDLYTGRIVAEPLRAVAESPGRYGRDRPPCNRRRSRNAFGAERS